VKKTSVYTLLLVLVIILLQAVSPYDAGADSLLKAAKPPKGPTPLTKAPKDGLLGGYIYKWDNSLQRWHQPIRIKHSKHDVDLVIAPYETFWIELAKKKGGNGVNIVFKDPELLNEIPESERVENAPPFTLFMGSAPPDGPFKQYFYQFTLPDANTNEDDLLNNISINLHCLMRIQMKMICFQKWKLGPGVFSQVSIINQTVGVSVNTYTIKMNIIMPARSSERACLSMILSQSECIPVRVM